MQKPAQQRATEVHWKRRFPVQILISSLFAAAVATAIQLMLLRADWNVPKGVGTSPAVEAEALRLASFLGRILMYIFRGIRSPKNELFEILLQYGALIVVSFSILMLVMRMYDRWKFAD